MLAGLLVLCLPALTDAALLRASPRAVPPRMMANPISFEEALDTAPNMCAQLQRGESPDGLADLIASSAGARGFFVNWLTGDEWSAADAAVPPEPLSESLMDAQAEVIEVMLMNVVMSAATAVAHSRAGNDEQADGSQRTCNRAVILVNAVWSGNQALQSACDALRRAVYAELGEEVLVQSTGDDEEKVDEWSAFLSRWRYDNDQLANAKAALALCGGGDDKDVGVISDAA